MLRSLDEADRDLLREATWQNLNWTGEQRIARDEIDGAPELRHYVDLRPVRGDFGFVVEEESRPVGVVWLLFLDETDPGYGFVRDGVPELSITVWPGHRGRGVGRTLLSTALAEARARGLEAVSLSVEEGNPAHRLYRRLGFAIAPGRPAGTQVLTLSAP